MRLRDIIAQLEAGRFYDGEGGGGGGGNPAPSPSPAPTPAPAPTDSFATQFESYLGRYGADMREAAYQLFRENFRMRDARRGLEEQLTEVRGQLPAQGSVVLTGDNASRWNEYTATQLTPQQIKEALGERDNLRNEVATARRESTLREVAEVSGFNLKPLARVGSELEYTIKEIDDAKSQGGKRRAAFVVTVGTDNVRTETPVDEYAREHWDDVLPALTTDGSASGQGRSGGPVVPRQPGQGQGNGAQQTVAQRHISSTYAKSGPQKSPTQS